MKISEEAQEILEKLWIDIVEEKNEFVNLKASGQESVIKELEGLKFIKISKDRAKLTQKGYVEAKKIIRRHRLAERLLHDILDIEEDEMETTACKFEHIISEGVEESICTLLGHPKVCPHGKTIPPSKCCIEGKEIAEKVVSSLSKLKKQQHGKIVYIQTKKHKNLQKLLAMNILPGRSIEVIQTYPTYVFQIDRTQIAVDKEIAEDIYIRIDEES